MSQKSERSEHPWAAKRPQRGFGGLPSTSKKRGEVPVPRRGFFRTLTSVSILALLKRPQITPKYLKLKQIKNMQQTKKIKITKETQKNEKYKLQNR